MYTDPAFTVNKVPVASLVEIYIQTARPESKSTLLTVKESHNENLMSFGSLSNTGGSKNSVVSSLRLTQRSSE